MLTTRKKVKVTGQQDYINANTGEIETMNVSSIEERDANFHKVWLKDTFGSFSALGNKKVQVLSFLLENMDRENKICMTQRQMATKSKISVDTIRKTIQILKKANFIISVNLGVYQINPEKIYKGGKSARQDTLHKYLQSSNTEDKSSYPSQSAEINDISSTGEDIGCRSNTTIPPRG